MACVGYRAGVCRGEGSYENIPINRVLFLIWILSEMCAHLPLPSGFGPRVLRQDRQARGAGGGAQRPPRVRAGAHHGHRGLQAGAGAGRGGAAGGRVQVRAQVRIWGGRTSWNCLVLNVLVFLLAAIRYFLISQAKKRKRKKYCRDVPRKVHILYKLHVDIPTAHSQHTLSGARSGSPPSSFCWTSPTRGGTRSRPCTL